MRKGFIDWVVAGKILLAVLTVLIGDNVSDGAISKSFGMVDENSTKPAIEINVNLSDEPKEKEYPAIIVE